MSKPPVEEGEEGAGPGVGQGGAARGGETARRGESGEALLNGTGEMALAEVENVANFLRGGHRGNELAHLADVGEKLLNGSDAVGGVVVANEGGGHHFEEVFDVAEEEIVFVAVVSVEGGAADLGAFEDVLDGDGFEGFFVHEGDQGIAKGVARGANTSVDFLFGGREAEFLCGGWAAGLFFR